MRTYLVIIILVSMTVLAGVFIGQGGSDFFFTSSTTSNVSTGLTGAGVSDIITDCEGNSCSVACYDNEDCDDRIKATEDKCRNPGTEFSICVNNKIK